MKKAIIIILSALISLQSFATDYMATVWGVKSDGTTDNTASIQRAIDHISANGGGTLTFYVGRYLSGAIQLKDNVTLRFAEGAVLVGSTNIYAYKGAPALIWAKDCKNVAVIGNGVLEGRAAALEAQAADQKSKGYIAEVVLPALISMENCTGSKVEDVKLYDSAAPTALVKSGDVSVNGVYVYKNGTVTTPAGKKVKVIK
ncbi:MAG: hypothetical protein KBS67_01955 [Bacteroidales bacterium]|nr:hypothetical protein [Candidatus Cryptobacteroides equifaecalis]